MPETLTAPQIYFPVLVQVGLAMAVAAGLIGASFALGKRAKSPLKDTPYESGMAPTGSARERFSVKFYMVVRALDAAVGEAGVRLPVYVEVNMGGNRCGVEPGEPALDLARHVAEAPHLAFAGLQAYHGSATTQWFAGMDDVPGWRGIKPAETLRTTALRGVEQTQFFPPWGKARLAGMIANRPDWTLSRQRQWGVPLPFFVDKETDALHPDTLALLELAAAKVERGGVEAWFEATHEDFGVDPGKYRKLTDTGAPLHLTVNNPTDLPVGSSLRAATA